MIVGVVFAVVVVGGSLSSVQFNAHFFSIFFLWKTARKEVFLGCNQPGHFHWFANSLIYPHDQRCHTTWHDYQPCFDVWTCLLLDMSTSSEHQQVTRMFRDQHGVGLALTERVGEKHWCTWFSFWWLQINFAPEGSTYTPIHPVFVFEFEFNE